jgi:hypothetical protein
MQHKQQNMSEGVKWQDLKLCSNQVVTVLFAGIYCTAVHPLYQYFLGSLESWPVKAYFNAIK